MLKKLFSIVLLLVYGLSSTGMTLHAHYCCGELEKVDFKPASSLSDCDTGCEMNGKNCCDEKQVNFNLKSEYSATKFIQAPVSFEAGNTAQHVQILTPPVTSQKFLPEIFAPPPLKKDLTVLYRVYRI